MDMNAVPRFWLKFQHSTARKAGECGAAWNAFGGVRRNVVALFSFLCQQSALETRPLAPP